ncbi:MAG: hypothetical protein V1870_01105 [Candidatus Aenigmatarchaeota archaeon]
MSYQPLNPDEEVSDSQLAATNYHAYIQRQNGRQKIADQNQIQGYEKDYVDGSTYASE